MSRMSGKVCLVTGGGGGIGQAIVRALLREGAQVVFTDLDPQRGKAVIESAEQWSTSATFVEQDVSDEKGWASIAGAIEERHGRLDVLVNNAATSRAASLEDETLDGWRSMHRINVESVFLSAKYSVPLMRKSNAAAIVNITSTTINQPPPRSQAAYVASKGAVDAFTRWLAAYFIAGGDPIRCNSVQPHATDTPLMRAVGAEAAGLSGEEISAMSTSQVAAALGIRLADPARVADAVLFLASDEALEINGSSLSLERGSRVVIGDPTK